MQRDSTRRTGIEMALHFRYQPAVVVKLDQQSLADRRESLGWEPNVDDGASDRAHTAYGSLLHTPMAFDGHCTGQLPTGPVSRH
jgi:hypothetical protein